MVELTHSGNAVVDKCIITFSTLILEVDILVEKARSTFYDALIIYGEDGNLKKIVDKIKDKLQKN